MKFIRLTLYENKDYIRVNFEAVVFYKEMYDKESNEHYTNIVFVNSRMNPIQVIETVNEIDKKLGRGQKLLN